MTRTEAAHSVRERWKRLGIGTPEEFPYIFSSDVDNLLEELSSTGNILDVAQGGKNDRNDCIGVLPCSAEVEGTRDKENREKNTGLCLPEVRQERPLDVADQGKANPRIDSLCVGYEGGEATAIASPLYQPLLIEWLTDSVIRAEEHAAEIAQYRAEEEAAAEEGALIDASGYQRPEYERNGR